MPVRLFARHAADEHQIHRSCVIDVGGDIHEALCRPPQGDRRPKGIMSFHEECPKTDHRHESLTERASKNRHEATKRDEEDVTSFMKGQIDQMEKRLAGIIRFKRCHDELPSPPNHGREYNRTTIERHRLVCLV